MTAKNLKHSVQAIVFSMASLFWCAIAIRADNASGECSAAILAAWFGLFAYCNCEQIKD